MLDNELTLRGAVPADLADILQLGNDTGLNHWTESDFSSVLESETGELTLALSADALVGVIASSSVIDEVTLLNVAVRRDHQRRGIARLMIQDMLGRRVADGAGRCLLEVRESNRGARALYKSLGFVVDGKRPDYYPVGEGREDAVLMSLEMRVTQ